MLLQNVTEALRDVIWLRLLHLCTSERNMPDTTSSPCTPQHERLSQRKRMPGLCARNETPLLWCIHLDLVWISIIWRALSYHYYSEESGEKVRAWRICEYVSQAVQLAASKLNIRQCQTRLIVRFSKDIKNKVMSPTCWRNETHQALDNDVISVPGTSKATKNKRKSVWVSSTLMISLQYILNMVRFQTSGTLFSEKVFLWVCFVNTY